MIVNFDVWRFVNFVKVLAPTKNGQRPRAYGHGRRTYVCTYYGRAGFLCRSTKTQLDGLPYFLNYGAPLARAFGPRGAPLKTWTSHYAIRTEEENFRLEKWQFRTRNVTPVDSRIWGKVYWKSLFLSSSTYG